MKAIAALLLMLNYLSVGHGGICMEGPQQFPAVQIDAGQGKVVMTDSNNYAYFLIGSQWYKMGLLTLKHVSVGPAGIWGVDLNNRVYEYVAGSFVFANGESLRQVDAGGDGQVVGVTDTSTIHCLQSTIASVYREQSTLSWITLPGLLMYVSCSTKYGCWGVNSAENIYFTKVTPSTCGISDWIHVDGLAVKVETGTDGSVFVVNRVGEVYQRQGIDSRTPQGTSWTQIPMPSRVSHVSYDRGNLWVVTDNGTILKCLY
ncbi:fish-egg lectin [Oreochromis niloticus]|uniref:Fish-egg lectin n=1 Tax=Oreochromis niloticus TaxID=8128 RepID=A0A669EZG4_ORENI|nr:fish-egg lectin [Oreochromis niloticus]